MRFGSASAPDSSTFKAVCPDVIRIDIGSGNKLVGFGQVPVGKLNTYEVVNGLEMKLGPLV